MQDGSYAATYDEWGFFLAALYRRDEDACVSPNFKHDTALYLDSGDFHDKTGKTYSDGYPSFVEKYGDDYPYRSGRNLKGRRGYGRLHADDPRVRFATLAPRTADFLRQLATGQTF